MTEYMDFIATELMLAAVVAAMTVLATVLTVP
jgi:hypothetical protein